MKEYEHVIILESGAEMAHMAIYNGNGIGLEAPAGNVIGHMGIGDGTFKGEYRESLLKAGVIGYKDGKVVLAYLEGDNETSA